MRVSSFLELLDLPLKLTLALLATVTFVARIPAVAAWPGRRYLGQLDLWTERSVAALCSGGFFALAAVSFAMLAWGETFAPRLQGRRLDRWALRAAALGLTFFSADEILEIHEKIGGWLGHSSALSGSAASEGVFSWVLLYGPVVIVGGLLVARALWRLIRELPDAQMAGVATGLLAALLLGPAALIGCEVIEAWLSHIGFEETPLGAVEETLELVVLYVIIRLNVSIAKGYET